MTSFIPHPGGDLVYVGGVWDIDADIVSGGRWETPTHAGLCQGDVALRGGSRQPAVIGPHLHWNGDYYMYCPKEQYCPTPSCHPAGLEDRAETLRREQVWRATAPLDVGGPF